VTQLGSPATESGSGPGPGDSGSGPRDSGPGDSGPGDSGPGDSGPGDSGRRQAAHGSRLGRRRRVLLGVGIAAALLAIGGLIGASFVKSPQQLAADTAAPRSTVTTATVVSQVLTSSVQMRGLVYPATEYDLYASAPDSDVSATSAPASSSSSGSSSAAGNSSSTSGSAGGSAALYITKMDVATGSTITNGKELAQVDGQPLFALTGTVPAWRDMTPGESGPDVTELQKALASLGYYDNGDTGGYFGSATEYAVTLSYEHLGFTAPSDGGVPEADVVFLPSLPATVVAVNGAAGQQPGQPFLELAARGSLALTGELPPAYAGQVKSGLKVTIYDEVTGIHATGTVSGVGTATTVTPTGTIVDIGSPASSSSSNSSSSSSSSGSSNSSNTNSSGNSGGTPFIPLAVHPFKALAGALNGENVLVTVDTGRTEGPVLTVPVAAIVTKASGTSYVTVVGAHGKHTEVTVTPGISENGYVQVTPAKSGALAAGDRVVVSG
jgi:Putative peptidoglycan binding domain